MRKIFRTLLNTRSRKARSRRTRHRYNRALFFAPIGLALLLVLLLSQNVEVLASVWRDPLSVLAARSPGHRDASALYNTKQKRLGLAKAGPAGILPHERVLAGTRMRPDPLLPAELADVGPLADFVDDAPIGTFAPGVVPSMGSVGGPGSFGAPGGFGGSPGTVPLLKKSSLENQPLTSDTPLIDIPPVDGPPGGSPPGDNPTDVSAAVPEPSTWLMNIVGLFAVAAVMRRGKRGASASMPAFAA